MKIDYLRICFIVQQEETVIEQLANRWLFPKLTKNGNQSKKQFKYITESSSWGSNFTPSDQRMLTSEPTWLRQRNKSDFTTQTLQWHAILPLILMPSLRPRSQSIIHFHQQQTLGSKSFSLTLWLPVVINIQLLLMIYLYIIQQTGNENTQSYHVKVFILI